jgi:hypothetical protein
MMMLQSQNLAKSDLEDVEEEEQFDGSTSIKNFHNNERSHIVESFKSTQMANNT